MAGQLFSVDILVDIGDAQVAIEIGEYISARRERGVHGGIDPRLGGCCCSTTGVSTCPARPPAAYRWATGSFPCRWPGPLHLQHEEGPGSHDCQEEAP